jgi:hypothetical protein
MFPRRMGRGRNLGGAGGPDPRVTEPEGSQTMNENTILHGGGLTLPPTLSANCAAMVLTDPPYLARYRDRTGRTV